MVEKQQESTEIEYKEHQNNIPEKWRWVMLSIFSLLSFSSGSSQVVYSPIMPLAQKYFDVSEISLLWHNNIWPLSYVILSIPVMYLLMNWKFSTSMYLSSFLNGAGAWIRYLAGSTYLLGLFGSFVIAAAQLWFLPAPAIITERWFPPEERQLATCIAVFANMMGISVGYIYSALFVVDDESKISGMQFYFACFMTLPFVLIILFFKENPKYFKNKIQEADQDDFKTSLKDIAKPMHIVNLVLLCMFVGNAWTYQAIIQNIIQPMGYGTLDIGYIGLVMNGVATAGGIFSSIIMENQLKKGGIPQYDLFIKFFITLETIMCVVLIIVMIFYKEVSHWIMYVITSLIGLGQSAYIPFGAQAYMESVYPVNEIVSMNAYFYVAQIPAFVFVFLSIQGAWLLNVVMAPFFFYLMFCYKTKLIRFEAERSDEQSKKSTTQEEDKVFQISMQEPEKQILIKENQN